jgi:hypothetical protein
MCNEYTDKFCLGKYVQDLYETVEQCSSAYIPPPPAPTILIDNLSLFNS